MHVYLLYIFFNSYIQNLYRVSNVIFCWVVGIVDAFFTMRSIKRWGTSSRKGEFFCHFIATNDDKHTTFQLLATKGDNEVVTAKLASCIEYGTQCISIIYRSISAQSGTSSQYSSSFLQIFQSHKVLKHYTQRILCGNSLFRSKFHGYV